MGYPEGEIPMTDVHGLSVAGATFPVPIWHEYMAAALANSKPLGFELPKKYPTWRTLARGYYGSLGYVYTAPAITTTTTVTAPPPKASTTPTRAPGGPH